MKFFDRIKETTITVGTGDITLAGAVAGFAAFSAAFSVGDRVPYCVVDGTSWEVGLGTFGIGSTLQRTLLYQSSTGSVISLSGATATVFLTWPAAFATSIWNRGRVMAATDGIAVL